jgi:hypothetical protein
VHPLDGEAETIFPPPKKNTTTTVSRELGLRILKLNQVLEVVFHSETRFRAVSLVIFVFIFVRLNLENRTVYTTCERILSILAMSCAI